MSNSTFNIVVSTALQARIQSQTFGEKRGLATVRLRGYQVRIMAYSFNQVSEDYLITMEIILPGNLRIIEFLKSLNYKIGKGFFMDKMQIPKEIVLRYIKNDPFIPISFPKKPHLDAQKKISSIFDVRPWINQDNEPEIYQERVEDWEKSLGDLQKVKKINYKTKLFHSTVKCLVTQFGWQQILLTGSIKWHFSTIITEMLRNSLDFKLEDQTIAMMMLLAINNSYPKALNMGEKHQPFGSDSERYKIGKQKWFRKFASTNNKRNLYETMLFARYCTLGQLTSSSAQVLFFEKMRYTEHQLQRHMRHNLIVTELPDDSYSDKLSLGWRCPIAGNKGQENLIYGQLIYKLNDGTEIVKVGKYHSSIILNDPLPKI